jgi:hypothetical protein
MFSGGLGELFNVWTAGSLYLGHEVMAVTFSFN